MAEIVAEYKLNVDKAVTELRKVADATEGTQTQLNKTEQVSKKVTTDMGGQFSKLGKQIAAAFGVTMGIAAFVNAIKGAITTTKEFEAQMSKVRAISGATASEMSKLEKSAKRLGSTTIFTATQVGQLQEEYARLGFTTKEILAATAATLDLAAATGETLAASAQVAGQTVRGFGLDASETTRVADVMALSFSKSALNLSDFTEGMKMVAPIARAANIPLETATALLGRLADAGLRGSMAGTALRNLLSKLADANSELSKELGFSVNNTEDLFRAFQELSKGHIDLTKATELTDERSKAAFITLLNGIDSVEELKTALDGAAGSAKAMADIMQDNFQGATIALTSAWEGFILSITNTSALEDATRAVTRFLQSMTGEIEASNAAFNDARAEVLQYKEELMGMSGTSILKAIGTQRDALADAENALIDLRKSSKDYATGKDFMEAVQAQELRVETLRSKFDAARKALQDFRDRQTELGDDLAPTADELERMSLALEDIEAAVPPPVRSIALLSDELKTLKDELQNAEIGSAQFLRAITDLQAKMQELADAEDILLRFEIDTEDTSAQDAIVQAEYDKFKEIQRLRDEHLAYLDKSISDELAADFEKIEAIEKAEKEARERKKAADAEARAQEREIMLATMNAAIQIIGSISQAQQQATDNELAQLQNALDSGQITREEYDQKRRQLLREQASQDKEMALLQAVIATAAAIAEALPNVPLSIIAGVLGAAQIAVIASQPLPQFEEGGRIGGKRHSQGGTVIEAEVDEFVVNRKAYLANTGLVEAINKGMGEAYIMRKWVAPAVDSALLNGWQDIGKSAELNNLTANLKDHNIIAAMDRNRQATTYGLKLLADKLDRRTPKRGGYA
jgi:TP901 family phage tail tape measure protein